MRLKLSLTLLSNQMGDFTFTIMNRLCIAIYRSTLDTLLAARSDSGDSIVKAIKGMIFQGFQRAKMQSNSKVDVAWIL